MGNTLTLCYSSSNKIYPIVKKKSKIFKKSNRNSKKKSKKKKSTHSNYIVIPQKFVNNIYSETQI